MAIRVFGSEMSPYSVKVRSYLRYKGIPHEWILRGVDTQAEFQKFAKLPLIPLVVDDDGNAMQDSTPIIEKLEALHPTPPVHPDGEPLAFLSALIEEFGDEWGNKWMFHYRWARPADQESGALRIARDMNPKADDDALAEMAAGIRNRMVDRVWFVGSSPENAPRIEASYVEAVDLLEAHLTDRPFLFGGRPVFGDYGLWAQLYQCLTDPTAGGILRNRAPQTVSWIERMLDPKAAGDLETWEDLAPTLAPFLERHVGAFFLPWSDANARAIADGAETFEVDLAGQPWAQKPQKYHARSLSKLRERYASIDDRSHLDPILQGCGCLVWLQAGG